MGCNQSTSKDVDDSRVRAPTSAVQAAQQQQQLQQGGSGSSAGNRPHAGSSAAIASPAKSINNTNRVDPNAALLSKSAHDRRILEVGDFLKDIVDRTASNFIDVMHDEGSALITTSTAFDRSKQYNSILAGVKINPKSKEIFDLPVPSKSLQGNAVADILGAPTLSSQDKDLILSSSSSIAAVFEQLAIHSTESIVATLPQF